MYRAIRQEFINKYAKRDANGVLDPMECWPDDPPKGYKNMKEYHSEFQNFVLSIIPNKYSDKKKTANQIKHFATRIAPINDLIWGIICGKYNRKGRKTTKELDGVSTFCHLSGLGDQQVLSVLRQVFDGEITAEQMRVRVKKLKEEERCFNASMAYIKAQLAIHNVI